MMSLIQRNYEEILNIYNNRTSVQIAYNTDVLQQGEGILLDRSTPNVVVVKNIEQSHTLDGTPLVNVVADFTNTPDAWIKVFPLKAFGNYVKISNGSNQQFDRDVNLYVDDSIQKWKNGQSYKIVVDHLYPMDMYTQGSFDLVVYTDALDNLNTGETYSKEIARISSSDFFNAGGTPTIEIVCIDAETYDFTFDLI